MDNHYNSNEDFITIIKEKFNIILVYVEFMNYGSSKVINLLDSNEKDLQYIRDIMNFDNTVCIYSKHHCQGYITTVGNITRYRFIKTAIDDDNGFKKCDCINKCKFVDITPYHQNLNVDELRNLLYNSEYSIFRNIGKDEKAFLDAMMYEKKETDLNNNDE